MFNFIRMGLVALQGTQSKREIQNDKFLPTIGFEQGTLNLRSLRTTWSHIHNQLKDHQVLPVILTFTSC